MQQATITPIHLHTNQVLACEDAGIKDPACNDENYAQMPTMFSTVLAVAANLLGGAILLSGLLMLPYLIGFMLS